MQTIGERLEDARKQKGISIRESAEATKIRGEYLQKFESNHFDLGLSEIYVRGFLRTYANFLKLPAERILNDYASLGHSETRPRQPNREIYGRMDVSVASAGERGDRSTPPPTESAKEAPRNQPKQSRSRTNLPAAPILDPALVLKVGKIAAAVLVLVLVIWGAKSIIGGISGSAAKPTALPPVATQAAAEPTITVVALDAVRVKIATVADGRVLLDATLSRGQTQVLPWPGELYITATAGENLQIEASGKRFGTGFKGYNRGKLPAPGGL
ncbi:MAG: helix-turn-helix domain-containing protein [Undibacterium sp.]|nr:helix-turn-helix domain-containing protein [Opitutaceae bacterium]